MTFTNFYNQPLRQVLAEAAEINRNNKAARRTQVVSATTTEVVSSTSIDSVEPALGVKGCKFNDNCRFAHDYDALAKLQEDRAAVKALEDSGMLCKRYRSPWGCLKRNCLLVHKDIEKPHKTSKPVKPTVDEVAEPEEILPILKPIVWEGNSDLGCTSYINKAICQIFGTFDPSKEQVAEWCHEMHKNGHFDHFSMKELYTWSSQLRMSSVEFSGLIAFSPGIFERLSARDQHFVLKEKAIFDAPKYDTFHCFNNLPNELCMQIWEFARRSERTVVVRLNTRTVYDADGPGIFIRQSPRSPLWYVNRQSREAAKRNGGSCKFYFGADYFSPIFDTLHFHNNENELQLLAPQVLRWRGDVVQKLSLPWWRFDKSPNMETFASNLFVAFPNVVEITLFLSDSDYHKKDVPKAPRVTDKARVAIHKACGVRDLLPLPTVRLAMMPEAEAMIAGVDTKW
ncbi:hypothetical protein DSL72_007434 [Monilinia vaccinii-corymbosi]|uniref:2EXR domain-containing protein n=1 Tax=Monilinia vaccinii-corymbosi TaxID=61207 RepID=A0A8A3PLS9_9HELO|nr:hypothetical protein DSL72_007434 [Monilinia vaccinii-corymbosi]